MSCQFLVTPLLGKRKTIFFSVSVTCYYRQRFYNFSEVAAQQTGLCSYERYTNLCNTPRAELDANKTDFFLFTDSSKGCSRMETGEQYVAFAQHYISTFIFKAAQSLYLAHKTWY